MKKVLLGISLLSITSTLTPAFSATQAQTVTVIGAQFGDESKGKITDLLANRNPAAVCRFNGGDNAGRTLVINGVKHKLSLIPSGIFHKNVTCFLGAGTTINPEAFLKEIAKLQDAGAEISPRNLKITANAPLILPLHKEIELIAEKVNNLNTTKKGIGPSYEDKAGRRAIRAGDLVALDHPENLAALEEKVDKLLSYHNALRRGFSEPEIEKSDVINYLKEISPKVAPFVADVATEIAKLQEQGKKILIEGAQSVWLDISHGTYPFVTSSNTLATAADSGLGIRLKNNLVLGLVKAYTTRVGNGPFPTLLNDATGEKIREIGHEFGAVTGRTRDTGWLDLVTLKQMIRMQKNINKSKYVFFSQQLMLRLVDKGIQRDQAYRIIQKTAHVALDSGKDFRDEVRSVKEITDKLSPQDLDKIFDLAYYRQNVNVIFKRVLG
ncbi:MAG: adenylosuccinate synthetase [Candidatus Paracaedibacteraceae bacterium]|nr:adenylosuccinate synthetase [Candidatus Paracaedibacteraceae bacterium]